MSIRYALSSLALAVAGGFTVISTYAFAHGTANAIDFALAIAITLVAAGAVVLSESRRQRGAALLTALIGAWTVIVTAGVFNGATQRWLTFAAGAAVATIALAARAGHDVRAARAAGRGATVRPLAEAQAA